MTTCRTLPLPTRTRRHLTLPLLAIGAIGACFDPQDAGSAGTGGESEVGTDASTAGETGESSGGTTGTNPTDPTSAEDSTSEGGQATTGSVSTAGTTMTTSASGSADDSSSDTSSSDTDEVDVTAPQIVSISPDLGVAGILADVEVVITFDEPMDEDATAAAFVSSDLGAFATSWNDDATVLTVTPGAPLAYASAVVPDDIDALEYTFTIGVDARDVAGNGLESEVVSSFFTARRFSTVLTVDATLTGAVLATGVLNTGAGGDALAGDGSDNVERRGFIALVLDAIPEVLAVEAATLEAQQYLTLGAPFTNLGDLSIAHVSAAALDADAFTDPALAELGVFSDDDVDGPRTSDITSAVAADLAAGRSRSQYRLEFAVATDGDGSTDRTRFHDVAGELVYLVE